MEEIYNLLDAAFAGNLRGVKQHLDRGVPVDSKDDRNRGFHYVSTITYNITQVQLGVWLSYNGAETSSSSLSSNMKDCISHKYSLLYPKSWHSSW